MEFDSEKYLSEMPPIVCFIKAAAVTKTPVGIAMFEKAITEYPEYFPEEVENRRKWALVPNEVIITHRHEVSLLDKEFRERLPKDQGGIFYWMDHPEEFAQWDKSWHTLREEMKIEERELELHNKYFSIYGLGK